MANTKFCGKTKLWRKQFFKENKINFYHNYFVHVYKLFSSGSNTTAEVLTLWMPIAECSRSHVTQADGAFATAVHKYIALMWMALSSCDYFSQFFHVGGLDVYNIWEHSVKEQALFHFTTIKCQRSPQTKRILKLLSVISKCHRFILRSSAERYVSWSLFTEMELMW